MERTKKVKKLDKVPIRKCKYCKNPIPKKPGTPTKRYNIQDFCNKEHYKLFHQVTKTCPDCNLEFETCKSSINEYCPSCTKKKAVDMKYKKKCANAACTNLIHHRTIYRFGLRRFCSLHCFVEYMGENLRRCKKCNNPLMSLNGSLDDYKRRSMHQNCGKNIYFFKKLEELAKRTYINYKEFPINDPSDTNTN